MDPTDESPDRGTIDEPADDRAVERAGCCRDRWDRPYGLVADGGRREDGPDPAAPDGPGPSAGDVDDAGERSDADGRSETGPASRGRDDAGRLSVRRLQEMDRRGVARLLATVGGLTALGSLAAPLASLTQVFERSYDGPVYTDSTALVDAEGERITTGRLSPGEQLTVFPETNPGIEDAPTLLVRFEEGTYGESTALEFTVDGYAAYSKVCTHAGCMVSDREDSTLVCPCHAGKFDPLEGAAVVGGPPPRPLPQLPITLASEGHLIATGDFPSPVGVGGG